MAITQAPREGVVCVCVMKLPAPETPTSPCPPPLPPPLYASVLYFTFSLPREGIPQRDGKHMKERRELATVCCCSRPRALYTQTQVNTGKEGRVRREGGRVQVECKRERCAEVKGRRGVSAWFPRERRPRPGNVYG